MDEHQSSTLVLKAQVEKAGTRVAVALVIIHRLPVGAVSWCYGDSSGVLYQGL
jgi:hypothetical protein